MIATTTGQRIRIEPIALADEVSWRDLWGQYQAFYDERLPEQTTRAAWSRLFDEAEPVAGFIAKTDNRPIGFVHLVFHRSFWLIAKSCYLQDLFVEPDHRGLGIGRKLIERAALDATERGCARLHWLTKQDNETAQHLYRRVAERSGFIQYVKSLEPCQ